MLIVQDKSNKLPSKNKNLLDLILKTKKYNIVSLDGFSLIAYKQAQRQVKNEISSQQNIFVFVLRGKKILYSEGKTFTIKENEAIFISKGTYLMSEILSDNSNTFESLVFFLDDSLLKEFFSLHSKILEKLHSKNNLNTQAQYEKAFKINVSPFLKGTIDSIIPFFNHENLGKETFLKYKFFEVLLEIISEDKSSNFINFLYKIQDKEIAFLQDFMENNFTENLTIEEFAKKTNRSLSKFKKDFSFISNLSPREWINNKKLDKAKTLLKTTSRSITEIALDLGFDNTSYFTKLFTAKFKESPKKFQKKLKVQK
ncbi:MAG: AraC family transcriptional regulator [Candidatus Sericytochromatia bacterium]